MKKFLKWAGIILGSLILIVGITVFVLVSKLNGRMDKTYDIQAENLPIPTDSASIAAGKHFTPLCQSCHGEAFQGKVFFEDPKIGKIYSPNLTKGEGGVGKDYKDADWIKAIRHGVNPKSKPLFVMPAHDLQHLGSADLANLIAYIKSVPAVDNNKGGNILPVFTKILMQVGAFGDIFSAETVKHDAPFETPPPQGATKEYGQYLITVSGCKTCHGTNYAGGKSPDPNSPFVPNLTPGGLLAKWSENDFITTLRTGVTPEQKQLNDQFMPWKHIGQLPDMDLTAMFKYLQSLPKTDTPKS